jgi:hypothetical protein
MTTYSIADFLSIMSAKSMGFSVAKAQCLIVSPWADAAVGMSIQESTRATDMCVFPSLVEMLLLGFSGLGMLGCLENLAHLCSGAFSATIAGE